MRIQMNTGKEPSFSEWIAVFHTQAATNPRDRIFAFLGLAMNVLPSPQSTSYNDSIEKVWADGTMLALYEHRSLDFICLGRGRDWGLPGGKNQQGIPRSPEERGAEEELYSALKLPSWVPNFRLEEGDGLTSACALPLLYYPKSVAAYKASGEMRATLFSSAALTDLHVTGYAIDKIKRMSKTNPGIESGPDGWPFLNEVMAIMADTALQCLDSCYSESCTHYPGPLGGSYPQAMYKTLAMDLDYESRRLGAESGFHTLADKVNKPPADFKPGETNTEAVTALWNEQLLDEKSRWTAWRRFVVTEQGYIGIAAQDCQVGDSIYILDGATIPFVMREEPSFTPDEEEKKFRFVGEWYLTTHSNPH